MSGDAWVGPYRIIRFIKKGGEGRVYLGYDPRLHRRVAIKIHRLPKLRAERKRWLHEARIIADLRSLRVVQVHDAIESSEHLAIVMEYVPGCDLQQVLDRLQLSLASILNLAIDIASGIAAARGHQVVHGDLKPSNILVDEQGHAKLTDFGIARNTAIDSSDAVDAGSPSCLAPEQLRGEALDQRTDLFALGCLLYRMLTGEQPFYRNGRLDSRWLLERPPTPVTERLVPGIEISPDMAKLVMDLLQQQPELRPQNTRQVREMLRRELQTIAVGFENPVVDEVRGCFRTDAEEDLPPAVPRELGRGGRWRKTPAGRGVLGIAHQIALVSWPIRLGVAGLLALLAWLGIEEIKQRSLTPVIIDAPVIRMGRGSGLPKGVDRLWLVEQVGAAVTKQLGPLRIIGPVGATEPSTFYSPSAAEQMRQPKDRLQIELRCFEDLCVLALSRLRGSQRFDEHALLFSDLPKSEWRDMVQNTARKLY